MRTLSTCAALASVFVFVGACAPKNQDNPPPNGMPPTGNPAYPPGQPPPGYPPGQMPPGYPGPGTMPTAAPPTAPTGSGQMSTPGPLAFQCKDDVPCGTHHCNLQFGKCAFPCQSAVDCLSPNTCTFGFCAPPMGAPAH